MSEKEETKPAPEDRRNDAVNKPQAKGKKAEREERLAQALRDNLRRRKAGRKKEE